MKEEKFAGVCIFDDGKLLLVKEAHKEAYGLWSFPLGHVEGGEKEIETAVREAKEETGYDIAPGKSKIHIINGKDFKSTSDFDNSTIKLTIFRAEVIGGKLKAGDDVLDAKWFLVDDLAKLSLRGEWLKFFINDINNNNPSAD